MARKDSLVNVLSGDECSQEGTSESITRGIGINDFVILEPAYRVRLRRTRTFNNNCCFGTLGDDNSARTSRIGFRQRCNRLRDEGQVSFVRLAGCFGPHRSFRFVANDDIGIREDLL
jgi:hypothetical protein